MRVFGRIIRVLLWMVAFLVVLTALGFAFLTWKDYRPAAEEAADTGGKAMLLPDTCHELLFLSWNIGYGGLGKAMDFFYDGGNRVIPPLEEYQRSLNGIFNLLTSIDTLDFILIQEVDRSSARSYFTDQSEILTRNSVGFFHAYVNNYKVPYVPFPLSRPMGKVESGLMNVSRFQPSQSQRIASMANFPWPKRLFFPDRCLLVQRFPVQSGKELVVVNFHNSAWTEGEALRVRERELIKKTVLSEYAKGNYVVAGGDWNQNPPGFNPYAFHSGEKIVSKGKCLDADFLPPGWQWCWDKTRPTNRDVDQAYYSGKTATTVIDFFICSPNVKVNEVKTLRLHFDYADHEPVYLRVKLMGEPARDSLDAPRLP